MRKLSTSEQAGHMFVHFLTSLAPYTSFVDEGTLTHIYPIMLPLGIEIALSKGVALGNGASSGIPRLRMYFCSPRGCKDCPSPFACCGFGVPLALISMPLQPLVLPHCCSYCFISTVETVSHAFSRRFGTHYSPCCWTKAMQ